MPFHRRAARGAASALALLTVLLGAGCASTGGDADAEDDPTLVAEAEVPFEALPPSTATTETDEESESEVPAAIAETERRETQPKPGDLPEVIVKARERHVVIRSLVTEGQAQLRNVELKYVFSGKGRHEVLRGRPVAFALWSESQKSWSIARLEIPRPPLKWKPGRGPLPFVMLTPGIQARHVKGTGAERLMFAFSRDGEELKVYGRKFPVFDNKLIKKKRWREAVATARSIVYLPYTQDTQDPDFITGGRDFLLSTARRAMDELRNASVPSSAYADKLLAEVIPPEVITTLAVIEQTDDEDYVQKGSSAFDEVLSQYGLKREEAYRYSVSSAKALGPMQFTNRRGNGTYSLVVRRCRGAQLQSVPGARRDATPQRDESGRPPAGPRAGAVRRDPRRLPHESGSARDLRGRRLQRYLRNVAKLHRALNAWASSSASCAAQASFPRARRSVPCGVARRCPVVKVSIPRYNRENSGYIGTRTSEPVPSRPPGGKLGWTAGPWLPEHSDGGLREAHPPGWRTRV
ncbi:MAG: hypothetical protein U1F35_07575 [Steroidobacteraceae bacterium]